MVFGFGGSLAYCPCTLYTDEWFVRGKGLAYGIVWSAAGFGGAVGTPGLHRSASAESAIPEIYPDLCGDPLRHLGAAVVPGDGTRASLRWERRGERYIWTVERIGYQG